MGTGDTDILRGVKVGREKKSRPGQETPRLTVPTGILVGDEDKNLRRSNSKKKAGLNLGRRGGVRVAALGVDRG
jgi:hypothetical protein